MVRCGIALLIGALSLGVGWGCAGGLRLGVAYDYFQSPDAADPWSRKIVNWQTRERSDRGEDRLGAPAAVAGSGETSAEAEPLAEGENLAAKYAAFRADHKRAMARDLAEWIQSQAGDHYVEDGPIDRWATLGETFRNNGDDCDGLELLSYHMLRELGFPANEVYRAIVYRRSDGQHHMVTLWFENESDPWVIDPTGAMTSGMPLMSKVAGWVPLKVFSEDEDFSVVEAAIAQVAR